MQAPQLQDITPLVSSVLPLKPAGIAASPVRAILRALPRTE